MSYPQLLWSTLWKTEVKQPADGVSVGPHRHAQDLSCGNKSTCHQWSYDKWQDSVTTQTSSKKQNAHLKWALASAENRMFVYEATLIYRPKSVF